MASRCRTHRTSSAAARTVRRWSSTAGQWSDVLARDVAKFDATARACALLEWEYRLVGGPDEIVTANVRWLTGSGIYFLLRRYL